MEGNAATEVRLMPDRHAGVDVVIRRLRSADRSSAVGVAARAFQSEEFMVGMLGADPLARYAGAWTIYDSEPWDQDALVLGAYAGTALLGTVRASYPGRCTLCQNFDPDAPPSDPVLRKEWEFEKGARETHLPYEDHGWISRMAVEPAVHGHGIGGRLLEAAVSELASSIAPGAARPPLLLEALASRETWYLAHGFTRVGICPDPWAERSYLYARTL